LLRKYFFRALLKIVLDDARLISGESNSFQALGNDMSGCLEVEQSLEKGEKKNQIHCVEPVRPYLLVLTLWFAMCC
jgi:hypothetical protein